MQKLTRVTKYAIVLGVVGGLIATGVVAGYVLSHPSLCAGVSLTPTPTSVAPVSAPAPAATPNLPSAAAPRAPTAVGSPSSLVIQVVAAENFWGSLVSQIGGTHVNVTSIISDPNTDPHEYEANDTDAKAIAHAQYIIVNNVGYDDWATSLIGADGKTGQTVLNVGDSLGVKVTGGIVTGNPHLWYNPTYVNETVGWMYDNLTAIAPSLTTYFTDQYNNVTASLGVLYEEVGHIRHHFAGAEVAATESIFVYLANATDLDLVSPPAFMEAVAEANDPPDQSVVQFECQLMSGNVHVLAFNAQTVTPLTTSMKTIAQENNVSVISVTETIAPPNYTFQVWMGAILYNLYVGLDAHALGE